MGALFVHAEQTQPPRETQKNRPGGKPLGKREYYEPGRAELSYTGQEQEGGTDCKAARLKPPSALE